MIDKFPKYLQQTKMAVRQRAHSIIQQVSLIIIRTKGDSIYSV